jgi:uncharacterized protein (TIGR03067 family)
MRRLLLLPLVLLLASCAGRPSVPPEQPTAVEPELAAAGPVISIEGKWREIKNENRPVMADKIWTFDGNTITINDGNRTYSGTFVYRKDREPKEIDIEFEGYPMNKAIYAIDGNVMNIKLVDSNPERASKLGVEPGYTSIMCERIRD